MPQDETRHPLRPAFFAVAPVACALLWLLCVATREAQEWVVGAGAILLTVALLALVEHFTPLRLKLRSRDFLQIWRLPWYMLSGSWEITKILFQDWFGKRAGNYFRVAGFDAQRGDPLSDERVALATGYTTVAPNFIILGVDCDQRRMLFHQLERSSVPKMTQALGARE